MPVDHVGGPERPRIAVFAGSTATILNSAPLITSKAARSKHGLPPLRDRSGEPLRYDHLRPQRLAAPVTVYIEAFSAHPLERDAAHLYAPPEWPHGTLGASGDRNLMDAVRSITSRIWAGNDDEDRIGAVLVDAERVITARDAQKADARPGGFIATGGHGGIVASMGDPGRPVLTTVPVWRHTWQSAVRLSKMPHVVPGCVRHGDHVWRIDVRTFDADGLLLRDAIPMVSIFKHARYLSTGGDERSEVELMARIDQNLRSAPLAGIVAEATAP